MNLEIEVRLKKIEACLDSVFLQKNAAFSAFYTTPAFPKNESTLLEICAALLKRGGKRWRPLLMHLVCESRGGKDAALPLTPLVELSHNASLIHDDIEDNSKKRRGGAAMHILYGSDRAINSGAFLYFLAPLCIDTLDTSFEFKCRLYSLYNLNMRRLHLGQSYDIDWHNAADYIPPPEDYYSMCALKTGVLSGFACELGVFCAEGAPEERERARRAGEKLGVGFQILDDVKNLTSGVFGKDRGDDIVEGKMSLPVLLFLSKDKSRMPFVKDCFRAAKEGGVNAKEVTVLIDALQSDGAITEAEKTGHSFVSASLELLASDGADCPASALLRNFADAL